MDDERTALLVLHEQPRRRRYRRRSRTCCEWCCWLCHVVFLVTLFTILITIFTGIFGRSILRSVGIGLPLCADRSDVDIPSLGLSLSISRGSGAVVFPDGEIKTLGSIEADDDFVDVIERLSKYSSRHLQQVFPDNVSAALTSGSRPYSDVMFGPPLPEYGRQFHRRLRQWLGLPATADVGVLAAPLKPLIERVREQYGCQPDEAVLVTPGIQALYNEDVEDIMTYLGLRKLPLRHYPYLASGCEEPHELTSVFAAHGFGLCQTYWDPAVCAEEEAAMAAQWVIGVSLNPKGIAISEAYLRSAYIGLLGSFVGFAHYGTNYKETYDNEDDYWSHMFETLDRTLARPRYHNITKVFIFDEVSDEDVHRLEDILRTVYAEVPWEIDFYSEDRLSVTAIGAAKFAQSGRYVNGSSPISSYGGRGFRTMAPDGLHCPWNGGNLNDHQ